VREILTVAEIMRQLVDQTEAALARAPGLQWTGVGAREWPCSGEHYRWGTEDRGGQRKRWLPERPQRTTELHARLSMLRLYRAPWVRTT